MSPIDVGGALPPPPPPPKDEDRDRTDREKDRERDDRAQRFLRTVHESAAAGRDRVAQHDAAVKRQAESEASDRDVTSERSDRERVESGRDGEDRREPDEARSSKRTAKPIARDPEAGDARRVAKDAAARGDDQRRAATGRDAARAGEPSRSETGDRAAPARTGATESGKADLERRGADRARGKAKSEASSSPPREEAGTDRGAANAPGTVAPRSPDGPVGSAPADPVIPRGIVRQAVEFGAFAERGGIIEFTLGMVGGPTLTLAALGNKKIQIRVDHRGAKTETGKSISRADLDDLIARLKERGIEVAEVELC